MEKGRRIAQCIKIYYNCHRGEKMIENINDLMGIASLLSIFVYLILVFVKNKIGKHKEKILTTSEKYYREW